MQVMALYGHVEVNFQREKIVRQVLIPMWLGLLDVTKA